MPTRAQALTASLAVGLIALFIAVIVVIERSNDGCSQPDTARFIGGTIGTAKIDCR